MMFCLSKGLGAPIGSILVGDDEFIAEARRLKILFGAAWRQAGIMAAAGLIALAGRPRSGCPRTTRTPRLLAEGIAEVLLPAPSIPSAVETNIVFVDVAATGHPAAEWAERLAADGVLVTMIAGRVRMLTHADVPAAAIGTALDAWRKVAADLAGPPAAG